MAKSMWTQFPPQLADITEGGGRQQTKSEAKVIFMTTLSLVRELEFLSRRRYDNCAHTSGRICFPLSLLVFPHQLQEPLSSLKSMAERAALGSGMEGDVPSLHLTSGNTL